MGAPAKCLANILLAFVGFFLLLLFFLVLVLTAFLHISFQYCWKLLSASPSNTLRHDCYYNNYYHIIMCHLAYYMHQCAFELNQHKYKNCLIIKLTIKGKKICKLKKGPK